MYIKAHIITIGDEILYGQILNTNAQWISKKMDAIGVKITQHITIGDIKKDILTTLKYSEKQVNLVLITGGLGPTQDDITKKCLAEYFGVKTVLNPKALTHLKTLFKQFKFKLTPINKLQAHLPTNCKMLQNEQGTAPGMWFFENNTVFISMPGIPFEMKALIKKIIIPKLKKQFNLPFIYHKVIKTIGIGESWLADKIKPWTDNLPPNISLAYLPSLREVKLRLTTSGNNLDFLKKEIEEQIAKLKKYAKKYIYGYNSDNIQSVVGKLLASKNETIATAESCTGGHLAHLITLTPGSSVYFKGSIIAYTNEIKEKQLNVKSDTLKKYGAVSKQTVIEMAENIRNKFKTTYGIATTGIAGPNNNENTPVGKIWIAIATPTKTKTKLLSLTKDRLINIEATSKSSLAFAWKTFV